MTESSAVLLSVLLYAVFALGAYQVIPGHEGEYDQEEDHGDKTAGSKRGG